MTFLAEVFRALWRLTLPVGAVSFVLVWWSLRRGYIKGDGGANGLAREIKALAASRKERKKAKAARGTGQRAEFDPVYEKWMKFGGGFYGVVAFYTYLVIEGKEILDFVAGFGGLWLMIQRLTVGAVIEILVESVINFVAALAWPLYWMNHLKGRAPWLILVAAYLGYWLGIRLARHVAARQRRPDSSGPDRDEG